MADSEEELKSLLMKVKEESEIVGLNKTQRSKNKYHGIWSHHFMANRWGNNGNNERLYFLCWIFNSGCIFNLESVWIASFSSPFKNFVFSEHSNYKVFFLSFILFS